MHDRRRRAFASRALAVTVVTGLASLAACGSDERLRLDPSSPSTGGSAVAGFGGGVSTGGAAGMDGAGGGFSGNPVFPPGICGRGMTTACGDDEFCDFDCASSAAGECRARPEECATDCPGVCTCEGEFFCNECEANRAGRTASAEDRSCLFVDGGAGEQCFHDQQCQPGLRCCYPCGVPGCNFECTEPTSMGECPPQL